jgi:hypothetical protein
MRCSSKDPTSVVRVSGTKQSDFQDPSCSKATSTRRDRTKVAPVSASARCVPTVTKITAVNPCSADHSAGRYAATEPDGSRRRVDQASGKRHALHQPKDVDPDRACPKDFADDRDNPGPIPCGEAEYPPGENYEPPRNRHVQPALENVTAAARIGRRELDVHASERGEQSCQLHPVPTG